jgi:hypothetical protein
MRGISGAGAILLVAGCSGGTMSMMRAGGGPLGDGTQLAASLEIPSGTTVTIPPGARITAAPGATITVLGVLTVASAAHPAVISTAGPTPDATSAWGGIVVESGGRLDAVGLNLGGASTALLVKTGSAGARYDSGSIVDAQIPFQIEMGARLDTSHAKVVNAGAASGIGGELHASYLDYETSSLGGGLIVNDASAVFDATDSTFHGVTIGGGDFITSYASTLVHVAYSTVNDAHCAFHFDDVARFELDHVTAGARPPATPGPFVAYGAMLYGSGAGPHVISNSNFTGSARDLDQQQANGPLTITNTFTTGGDSLENTSKWAAADHAAAPIPDAHPR